MPNLTDYRKKAKLTQAELAARSGLRAATISALENGRSSAHPGTVRALASALNVEPDTIRAALAGTQSAIGLTGGGAPIERMGKDWAFQAGLDADLRAGLARSLVAEWTHSSTALEGNTISAGDTLFVLTEGLTVSGKSLREHQELHGHAEAIGLMASWDGNGRMARLLANIPVLRAGLPPLLVSAERRRDYIALMGDYSLGSGQVQPGEGLVRPGAERAALRRFFAGQWLGTRTLVAEFHERQAAR